MMNTKMGNTKKFSFKSEDRNQSFEKLDEYLRVAEPGIPLLALAIVLVAAALLVWGIIGKIPVTITVEGYIDVEKRVILALPDVDSTNEYQLENAEVTATMIDDKKVKGRVTKVLQMPLTSDEVLEFLPSSFHVQHMMTGDYAYYIEITPIDTIKGYDDQLCSVTITLEYVMPIKALFGN